MVKRASSFTRPVSRQWLNFAHSLSTNMRGFLKKTSNECMCGSHQKAPREDF